MSSGISTLSNSDFVRSGGGFSFTGKLAEIVKNSDWTDGYYAVANGDDEHRNGYSFLWEAISAAAEEPGNELYTSIRNYVDNIGNIDTCGLDGVRNFMNELKLSDSTLSLDFRFPNEIKKLVEIFSVNTAYVVNKSSDRTDDDIAPKNSILHYTTVAKIAEAATDSEKYAKLARDVFFNTLMKFLKLKVGEVDRKTSTLSPTDEIWTINISKLTNGLWDDDVTSEKSVYDTKVLLGVDKSFSEKTYVDDIIAGRRSIDDFAENEQRVLKAELASREVRYGSDSTLSHYYIRLYKVIEYFRFTTSAYRNAYNTSEYDLDNDKYVVTDRSDRNKAVLRSTLGEYSIDEDVVMSVAGWLADYSMEVKNLRNSLKKVAQKNMLSGTKTVITDSIREFLMQKIDSATWKSIRSSTLFDAKLNRNFEVSVVEYTDPTEYYNIDNESGITPPVSVAVNGQYWEGYYDEVNTLDHDDIRKFYNSLAESKNAFVSNYENGSDGDVANLYEFLTAIFEMGATNAVAADLNRTTTHYSLINDSSPFQTAVVNPNSNEALSAIRKYSGDSELGESPYLNVKNQYFTSYQAHQFIGAFDEYTKACTGVMNLVNSFSNNIADSWSRLGKRLDGLGNTINFWLNWNEDFTGYSSWFEKGGDDYDAKLNQDSPFNFDALESFLATDSYISTLLDRTNQYYISDRNGKFLLTDEEVALEVLRLQKFREDIKEIRGREIYKYGCDNYGNTYMLYKDAGNRSNRDALGDMWIRLDRHPIAFPLFCINQSNGSLDKTSCMGYTNNSKLLEVLSNKYICFESEYGLDGNGSSVAFKDVSVASSVNERSAILKHDSDGNPIQLEPPSSYSAYERGDSYFLVNPNFAVESGETYTYYVDTADGTDIPDGTEITLSRTLTDGTTVTETLTADGKPFGKTEGSFAAAEFKNGVAMMYSRGGPFVFARYSSTYDNDPNTFFHYVDRDGTKHAVAQHTLTVDGILESGIDCLSGKYDLNGDISIDSVGTITAYTSSVSSLSDLDIVQTVDGGVVYEDFASYEMASFEVNTGFGYTEDDVARVNSCLCGNTPASGFMAYVGGSNPAYVEQFVDTSKMLFPPWESGRQYTVGDQASHADQNGVSYDYRCIRENEDTFFYDDKWLLVGEHDDRDDDRKVLLPPSVFLLKRRDGFDVERKFVFSNSSYYCVDDEHALTYRGFDVSDAVFSESEGYLNDTIRTFYNASKTNKYYPYTTISKVVSSEDDEAIASINSPVQSITVNGTKLYYKVIPTSSGSAVVSGCEIDSHVAVSTLRSTAVKFSGTIVLNKSENDQRPIELTFSNSESSGNDLHYASLYSSMNQKKFNDFEISYDQKSMFLSYADGDGTYVDSGTCVWHVVEDVKHGVHDTVEFARENYRNLDGIDTNANGMQMFHVGDAYNHDCTISVYGSVEEDNVGTQSLKLSIYSFIDRNVYTTNFSTELKFKVHEFEEYGRSRYSFNANATEDRLYVSFTCDVPDSDANIGNTLNGVSTGTVGTAKFGNIERFCGDSVVTILSFDISEPSEPKSESEEIRYIMQNGEIGYFPQFAGVLGKNVPFNNDKLTNDIRYPFYAQFDEFDSNSSQKLVTSIHASSAENHGLESISRFVPIYGDGSENSSKSSVRGFMLEDGGRRRSFYTELDLDSETGSYCASGYEGVYDISVSRIENSPKQYLEVSIAATCSDYSAYVPGIVFSNRKTTFELKKELLCFSLGRRLRTDFKEFFDSEDGIFAFHADGHTVSKLTIENVDGELVRSGAVGVSTLGGIINSNVSSGFIGETDRIGYGCAFNAFSTELPYSDVGTVLYVNEKNWGEYSVDNFPSDGKCVAVHIKTPRLETFGRDFYVRISSLTTASLQQSFAQWSGKGTVSEGAPYNTSSPDDAASWDGRSATVNIAQNASHVGDDAVAMREISNTAMRIAGSTLGGFVGTKLQLAELAEQYATIRDSLKSKLGIIIADSIDGVWTSTQFEPTAEGKTQAMFLSSGTTFASAPKTLPKAFIPLFETVGTLVAHFDSYHVSNDGTVATNSCWEDAQYYTSIFSTFIRFDGEAYPHTIAFGSDFIIVHRFPSENGNGESVYTKITDSSVVSGFGDAKFTSFSKTSQDGALVFTLGGSGSTLSMMVEYGSKDAPSVTCHWNDEVLEKLVGETVSDMRISEGGIYNMLTVNCSERAYVMYVDKNITFSGSVAEFSKVFDSDGVTEIVPNRVGRCCSFGQTMAIGCNYDSEDVGESYVIVSTDHGKTFVRQDATRGMGINVFAATKDSFFGSAAITNSVLSSEDGTSWSTADSFVPGKWTSVSTAISSYMLSVKPGDADYDLEHRVRISSQTTLSSAEAYDSMCVDKDGNVVLYRGLRGGRISIARSKDVEGAARGYEEFSFNGNGCDYSSAYLFGEDLFFAPTYSTNVIVVSGASDFASEPSLVYISVSNELNNKSTFFNGFNEVNGVLVMYPKDGTNILAYSSYGKRFFNYFTDSTDLELVDSDDIGTSGERELLFTPYRVSANGSVEFTKTCFCGRNDYGIVELDNGFPIMVKYCRISGQESTQWALSGDVYQFTFTLMNDVNKRTISVITSPVGYVGGFDAFKKEHFDSVCKSCVYAVGGESIAYSFETVDETTKYCIKRHSVVETKETPVNADTLSFTYVINGDDRRGHLVTYSTKTSNHWAYASVIEGYTGFQNYGETEEEAIEETEMHPNISFLPNMVSGSYPISSFRKYPTTDTAEFSGAFDFLRPYNNISLIDCNFNFTSPSALLRDAKDMFFGCENATFASNLVISSTPFKCGSEFMNITSTARMFKNCYSASLPNVRLDCAERVADCSEMFYGCANAVLSGVTIPPAARYAYDMFKGCVNAPIDSVSGIPDGVVGLSGMFEGCANAPLRSFSFANTEFVDSSGGILYVNGDGFGEYEFEDYPLSAYGNCVAVHVTTDALFEFGHDFYIRSKDISNEIFYNSRHKWQKNWSFVDGVTTSLDTTVASAWDGVTATNVLLSSTDSPAAKAASAEVLTIDGREYHGFIGTALQMREFFRVIDTIANDMLIIQSSYFTKYVDAMFFTSTQRDAQLAFVIKKSKGVWGMAKISPLYVFPLFSVQAPPTVAMYYGDTLKAIQNFEDNQNGTLNAYTASSMGTSEYITLSY